MTGDLLVSVFGISDRTLPYLDEFRRASVRGSAGLTVRRARRTMLSPRGRPRHGRLAAPPAFRR